MNIIVACPSHINPMRTPLLFSSLLAPCLLQAQITLGPADVPSAGDTMRYWNAALATFDDADTGPGHVWDFSTLVGLDEAADTAVTVGSTPLLYQFFFNNGLLYPDHDANYAVKGTDLDFQQLTLTDLYDYFKVDADGFDNVGFGANINGIPASVQRLPVDHIYRFPLDYGNMDTSSSNWEITVPTLLFFSQAQTRFNEVDGWGTLYLPEDTVDVLRVRSTLQRTDSVYIDQFGIGFSLPEPETVEYKWLAVGRDFPVLQVNVTGGIPVLVRFQSQTEPLSTGIAQEERTDGAIYPNPATDVVYVQVPEGVHGQLGLFDAQGREVRRVGQVNAGVRVAVDVSELAAGRYALRVAGADWNVGVVVR